MGWKSNIRWTSPLAEASSPAEGRGFCARAGGPQSVMQNPLVMHRWRTEEQVKHGRFMVWVLQKRL
jgi:hypothetical protein